MAYTLVDVDSAVPPAVLAELAASTACSRCAIFPQRYGPAGMSDGHRQAARRDRRARRRLLDAPAAPRRARAAHRHAEGRRAGLPPRARGAGAAPRRAEAAARCRRRPPRARVPRDHVGLPRARGGAARRLPRARRARSARRRCSSTSAARPRRGAAASIDEVFRRCETGAAQYGVVPVENSTEGAIGRTLDLLLLTPLQDLRRGRCCGSTRT